jgi:hypothetical protein
MENTTASIIEITTFTLTEGITEQAFSESAKKMQREFLEQQPGYQQRILSVSETGIWTDIVFWDSKQSVENAMRAAEQAESVFPFMQKIDFSSVKMNVSTPIELKG